MLCDACLQSCPVPPSTLGSSSPQVELQQTLACRRTSKCLIWTITFSQLTRGFDSR